MPVKGNLIERVTFFGDPELDSDLPKANEVFWASMIGHIEQDFSVPPRVILDIGCHTGGLLHRLNQRFSPAELFGVEPLAAARLAASRGFDGSVPRVWLLDPSEWDRIPSGAVDLITSHETLYLEPDVHDFMKRVRRVLAPTGSAYLVLGCHSENPLWEIWKAQMLADGHRVYDHLPLEIMKDASSEGLLPSVQPLRSSGWITYDPVRAKFLYPDLRTMLDHHYRYKLIFRLRVADDRFTHS
jgi:SAM-dependent methyltransferase